MREYCFFFLSLTNRTALKIFLTLKMIQDSFFGTILLPTFAMYKNFSDPRIAYNESQKIATLAPFQVKKIANWYLQYYIMIADCMITTYGPRCGCNARPILRFAMFFVKIGAPRRLTRTGAHVLYFFFHLNHSAAVIEP